METMDAQLYTFIKRKVLHLTAVDLNCYKAPQVQRRLRTYLVRSGYPDWHKFFRAMQDDPAEIAKLKDYLTINVSSFFRDKEKFDYLRDPILAELKRGRPRMRVWSVGCSHGHEPYSLAILLAETTGFYRQHHVWATDIDHSALARTERGGPYSAEEVEKVPPDLFERYFNLKEDGHYVIEGLRRKLTVDYHNVLVDPFEQDFDLIVCRNVVIYFTAEVKNRLYRLFYQALRPGGVLFVGGTEVISQATDIGFETAGISFYRRKV
ncbi:MAG TPA: protein-glutamate O-methyltransferase CheR [Chloroflexi bacterium]|nr:protein-glutamate O-methyltransferase CheR [Chloroflexota bacterium]